MIKRHGKPMTFEDIRAVIRKEFEVEDGIKLYSSFERSLRRALHLMVSDGGLIAIGDGGRGDPFRYSIHPRIMRTMCDTEEEFDALLEVLAADPGASKAWDKCMGRDA